MYPQKIFCQQIERKIQEISSTFKQTWNTFENLLGQCDPPPMSNRVNITELQIQASFSATHKLCMQWIIEWLTLFQEQGKKKRYYDSQWKILLVHSKQLTLIIHIYLETKKWKSDIQIQMINFGSDTCTWYLFISLAMKFTYKYSIKLDE